VQQQSADRFDMKRVLSAGDLTSVMNDDHDNGLPFTQQRSRRNKRSKKTSNVINDVVCSTQLNPQSNSQSQSQSQSVQSSCATSQATPGLTVLQNKIEDLLLTVRSQQETIEQLSAKLNFVLSFLDITTDNSNGAVSHVSVSAADSDANSASPPVSTVPDAAVRDAELQVQGRPSYVDAARAGATAAAAAGVARRQPTSLRAAVVAAVSAEQRDREKRAKSVIVSGMTPSPDSNDKLLFKRLCMLELGVEPEIAFTRRLGVDRGGIRPLLVGLQSEGDVLTLMSRAKLLRQSASDTARRVFINRNLNKEEAQLAYESRCRRRQRQQQQRQQQHSPLQQRSVSTPSTSLLAGAAEFVPVAAAAVAASSAGAAAADGDVDGTARQAGRHR